MAESFFVRIDNDVTQFDVSLTVETYKTIFVCRVVYGTADKPRKMPIYGATVWQAFLTGLKILFAELKAFERGRDARFFYSHESATADKDRRSVEEIFIHMGPLDARDTAPEVPQ
ncbi:MAG: hypothetical protein H0U74_08655 [Bradymonadaceae bacterium]|nr:hypothetical protein [Lujinxingiaceae bacterium]